MKTICEIKNFIRQGHKLHDINNEYSEFCMNRLLLQNLQRLLQKINSCLGVFVIERR